jgi:hypothetical protein
MNWFAAHLVLYVKLKEEPQDRFPLWENIVLLKADSEEEAFEKAERRGREDEGDDDGSFRWGGKPARWVFAGVRKVTACVDSEKRPADGTEITFLEMEAASKETIDKLLDGEAVSVKLTEQFSPAASGK